MKEQVKGIIYDFKKAGWTVQKIEQELKFSNGTLGKVVNDKAGMSDFRFCQLLEFHQSVIKSPPTVTKELKVKIAENNLSENKSKIEEERNTINSSSQIAQYEQELTTLPDKGQFAIQRRKWLQKKIYELKSKLQSPLPNKTS